ncbi:hypothetical protein [Paraburkholderia sp. J7]|uniref:hypothetical protein n=1 Tax=Paraburkholderia sp. J7 TaxID=2805438 RepID=UPI002AB6308B|nr:hypothetical protein [Paraburkholderia sp. J7]
MSVHSLPRRLTDAHLALWTSILEEAAPAAADEQRFKEREHGEPTLIESDRMLDCAIRRTLRSRGLGHWIDVPQEGAQP